MPSPQRTLSAALEARGVFRREFVEFCSAMVAMLALPPRYVGAVVKALAQANRPILVWLEFQDCAGNSESMFAAAIPRSPNLFSIFFPGNTTSCSWLARASRRKMRSSV
jgi:Ni,Fe-hydrogenase I small subunit